MEDRDGLELTTDEQRAMWTGKQGASTATLTKMHLMPDLGVKFDEGKLRYSLIPNQPIRDIIRVLMVGAKKYGDYNWQKGLAYSRVYEATKRHIDAWWDGEDYDQDDGLSHLAHAACNLVFLLYYEWKRNLYKQFDDRPLIDERRVS